MILNRSFAYTNIAYFVFYRLAIIDIRTKKQINDSNTYIKITSKINLLLFTAKYILIAVALLSFIFVLASPDANSDIWYSNSDKNENPPFATVADFVPENASLKSEENNDPAALFNKWSNSVSAVNYYWRENDMLIHPGGTSEEIQLNVDYHETISPLLSKWTIWDLLLLGGQSTENHIRCQQNIRI